MRITILVLGFAACAGLAPALAQEPQEAAPTALAPVVVTGERVAPASAGIEASREEVQLTPGGVTLIDGDILHEHTMSSLQDMLRYVPGVWVVSHSGNDSIFISSRGSNLDATDFDRNGVKLLLNGLPVTAADGNNHNRIIDPLSARYAVFARGANAMKYGASTLGGAINFISPTAYSSPPMTFLLSGGSFGQVMGRATLSTVFNDRLDGLLTLEGKRREGYREHGEMDQAGLYANGGWRIADGVGTRLYLTYAKTDQELTGSLTRAQFEDDPYQAGTDAREENGDFQHNLETVRLANKTSWVIGDDQRLEFGVSYEEQQLFHPIVADFGGDNRFFDGLVIDTEHRNIGAMLRYEHRIATHNLLFGANFVVGEVGGRQFGNDRGEPGDLQTRVDQEAQTLEVFAMDRWRLDDRWTLIAGLQFVDARRQLNNTPFFTPFSEPPTSPILVAGAVEATQEDYASVNPRLGVIYHLQPGFDLFASVSRLYEPPTNFELDDETGLAATPPLDAMSGTVAELGTRGHQPIGQHSGWGWDLALYYAWIDDEILSVENPMRPNTSSATNIDSTIHAGIEALVNARFALDANGTHSITPILSLTVNEFEFDDDPNFGNNQLPAAPEYALKGEVLYRHARGYYAGPTFDVVGERFADFANSYRIDSYSLLGFIAGWADDRLRLALEVENLLDEEYVATHSVRANAAPTDALLNAGAPFSVYASVQLRVY